MSDTERAIAEAVAAEARGDWVEAAAAWIRAAQAALAMAEWEAR